MSPAVSRPPPRDCYRDEFIFDMEVLSIADFDREQAGEEDGILNSAVDQLEALTQSSGGVADIAIPFGALTLTDGMSHHKFTFVLPTTCPSWPGPLFGTYSLHKVIAKPATKAKSNTKESLGRKKDRKHAFTRNIIKEKRAKKDASSPKKCTSVASRDPPLRLLTLPPEIRNTLWSLLAVQKEPIEAQLRKISPCKKIMKSRDNVIRRFAREPVIASANKQVRREVMSIFYGTNRFVFEKNSTNLFTGRSMTNPGIMQMWKPQGDLAKFLSHVDIRLNSLPRIGSMHQTVFMLRRLADGKITIDVKAEKASESSKKKRKEPVEPSTHLCLCNEITIIAAVQSAKDWSDEADLMEVAMELVRKRGKLLFGGLSVKKIGHHYPIQAKCDICNKESFEIVYDGM